MNTENDGLKIEVEMSTVNSVKCGPDSGEILEGAYPILVKNVPVRRLKAEGGLNEPILIPHNAKFSPQNETVLSCSNLQLDNGLKLETEIGQNRLKLLPNCKALPTKIPDLRRGDVEGGRDLVVGNFAHKTGAQIVREKVNSSHRQSDRLTGAVSSLNVKILTTDGSEPNIRLSANPIARKSFMTIEKSAIAASKDNIGEKFSKMTTNENLVKLSDNEETLNDGQRHLSIVNSLAVESDSSKVISQLRRDNTKVGGRTIMCIKCIK